MDFPEDDDFDEGVVYHYLFFHLIIAVAYRHAVIDPEWKAALKLELDAFLGQHSCECLETAILHDHVHLVFRGHPDLAMETFILELKSRLAHWVQQQRPTEPAFAWQEGFACFSLGPDWAETREYLAAQESFHRDVSFMEEYPMLLEAQGIDFDPDDLFKPLE